MKVLVACERSGRVRDAFQKMGHDAWSCDIQPDINNNTRRHLQENVLNAIHWADWDMMIAFPPCQYLSRSGARWLYQDGVINTDRYAKLRRAANFFQRLRFADIPKIAIENPTPFNIAHLPPHSQVIQPYEFGHPYTKRTLLWLKNLPQLEPTSIVDPVGSWTEISRRERDITFTGIAQAMAEQWGVN